MRKPRRNDKEQIEFAEDLLDVTGINLLDGRHIQSSITQHRSAEKKRAEHRHNMDGVVEKYLAMGGKITVIPAM